MYMDVEERNRTLFVTNMHKNVTKDLLEELFVQAGPIDKVTLSEKDQSNRFAFILFEHAESVPFTITIMNGVRLFGTALHLKPRQGSDHEKVAKEKGAQSRGRITPLVSTPPIPSPMPQSLFGAPRMLFNQVPSYGIPTNLAYNQLAGFGDLYGQQGHESPSSGDRGLKRSATYHGRRDRKWNGDDERQRRGRDDYDFNNKRSRRY